MFLYEINFSSPIQIISDWIIVNNKLMKYVLWTLDTNKLIEGAYV